MYSLFLNGFCTTATRCLPIAVKYIKSYYIFNVITQALIYFITKEKLVLVTVIWCIYF